MELSMEWTTMALEEESGNGSCADGVSAVGGVGGLSSLNYELAALIAVAVSLLLLTLVTALGNALVGVALVRYRRLRSGSVSNCLIGNLALSDLLLAVTVLPLSTAYECLGRWPFGRVACNVWLIVDVLYCTASIWNLCAIAADRFTATMYPLWYRDRRSTSRALLYVAVVWAVATATCVPPMIGWTDQDNYVWKNETSTFQCEPFQTPGYVVYSASTSFFVPFLVTFVLYARIFVVLRRRMALMRSRRQSEFTPSLPRTQTGSSFLTPTPSGRRQRGSFGAAVSAIAYDAESMFVTEFSEEKSSAEKTSDDKTCGSASPTSTAQASSWRSRFTSSLRLPVARAATRWRHRSTISGRRNTPTPASTPLTDVADITSNEAANALPRRLPRIRLSPPDAEGDVSLTYTTENDSQTVDTMEKVGADFNQGNGESVKLDPSSTLKPEEQCFQREMVKEVAEVPVFAAVSSALAENYIRSRDTEEGISDEVIKVDHGATLDIVEDWSPASEKKQLLVRDVELTSDVTKPEAVSNAAMTYHKLTASDCHERLAPPADVVAHDASTAATQLPPEMTSERKPSVVRFAEPVLTGSETQETILSESGALVDKCAVPNGLADSREVVEGCGGNSRSSTTSQKTTAAAATSSATRRSRDRSERREMRATVRMAAIIGVFCAMWLGFFSVYVARGVGGDDLDVRVPRWLDAFLFWLGYANSTVNPLLYAVFNVEFRRAFQHIIADCCCRCCPALRRRLTKHPAQRGRLG